MAWEYQVTRAPTSTVTSSVWAVTQTSSGSSSAITSGTILSQNNVSSSGMTAAMGGTSAFLGTGCGVFTTGGTATFFEAFELITWTSTSTHSQTSSAEATVGTTRTVFTGTGGTKRESSYISQYNVTIGSESGIDGLFTGGHFRTALTLSTFLSRTLIGFEDALGVVTTQTTTSSGTITQQFSFTFNPTRTWSYTSSTVGTATTNTTATVTTTSNKSYTFPASTTGPGTTSASSIYLATTTLTVATTTSVLSFTVGTFDTYRVVDTVVHCDSTDWGWSSTVTSTATGQISDIAASFTGDITVLQRGVGRALTWTPVSASWTSSRGIAGNSSLTTTFRDEFVTTGTTTGTFALRTTQLQTYTIGAATAGSNFAPLTTQITISRTVTTTTASTFTFHSTTTTQFGVSTSAAWLSAALFSCPWTITLSSTRTGFDVPTYTTTSAGGAVWDTNQPDTLNTTASTTSSASNATVSTFGTSYVEGGHTQIGAQSRRFDQTASHRGSFDRMNYSWNSVSASPPSFVSDAIAGGFQAWGSEGRGSAYFQNLDGGGIPILSFGHIYPNVIVPLMDQVAVAYTAGTTTATSRYDRTANHVLLTQQTGTHTSETAASTVTISATGTIGLRDSLFTGRSTIGGFGWDSTRTLTITASQGIHRYTLLDSSGGTSTGFISWGPTASTFTIPYAHALALETVPKGTIFRTNGFTNFISPVTTFSAFPVS